MARLGRRVHDGVRPEILNQRQYGGPVPDVDGMVMKISQRLLQPPGVPGSVALGPEEVRPHVVVDAVNLPAFRGEKRDDLTAD